MQAKNMQRGKNILLVLSFKIKRLFFTKTDSLIFNSTHKHSDYTLPSSGREWQWVAIKVKSETIEPRICESRRGVYFWDTF